MKLTTQTINLPDKLTVIAIGVISYAVVNVCHEVLGHCGMALLMGTKCTLLSSTYIPLAEMPSAWKYNIIVIAGCLSNFITASIALFLLRRLNAAAPATRFFLWLLMSLSFFLPASYIAAAPIIKYGDSYILIEALPHQLLWRIAVTLAGATILVFCFQLVRYELAKLVHCGGHAARTIAWNLVLPVYLAGGLVTVASAAFSQLAPKWAQLQAAGGTFGLTIWLLLLPWVMPSAARPTDCLALTRSLGWIVAGTVTAILFIGVWGHGISVP